MTHEQILALLALLADLQMGVARQAEIIRNQAQTIADLESRLEPAAGAKSREP